MKKTVIIQREVKGTYGLYRKDGTVIAGGFESEIAAGLSGEQQGYRCLGSFAILEECCGNCDKFFNFTPDMAPEAVCPHCGEKTPLCSLCKAQEDCKDCCHGSKYREEDTYYDIEDDL